MTRKLQQIIWCIVGLVAILVFLLNSSPASSNIVDVSWPNCEDTGVESTYGIVGVSGGLSFHSNKCLGSEAGWFIKYALYINSGYPGPLIRPDEQKTPLKCSSIDLACKAYNYGYNSAVYAASYANSQGVHSSIWWVDVETDNSWTSNYTVNISSLKGIIAALNNQIPFPVTVGIYSDATQWQIITGSWHSLFPEWVASGGSKLEVANAACRSKSFTGGSIWLGQYTQKLDKNLACSADFINSLNASLKSI